MNNVKTIPLDTGSHIRNEVPPRTGANRNKQENPT
jgi:hypothetical protein